jgi:hypothetical protein
MPSALGTLSRAAFRFTASVFRRAGVGEVHPDWAARAAVCERCPLRVLAGNVSYCGQPIYRKPDRDVAEEGCGCPTREKAKDPGEHCPLTVGHLASSPPGAGGAGSAGGCDCKWCASAVCPSPNQG